MIFYIIVLTMVTVAFLIFLTVFLCKNYEYKKLAIYATHRRQIERHRYFEDVIAEHKDAKAIEVYDDKVVITL